MTRKIVTRSGNTHRFRMPSAKNGETVDAESTLERDQALRLEFAPHVRFYRSQPERFHYPTKEGSKSSIPDFEVVLEWNDIDYLEVKYKKKANEKKTRDRTKALKKVISAQGARYRVQTEKEIRTCRQVLQNCAFLLSYKWGSRGNFTDLKEGVPTKTMTLKELGKSLGSGQVAIEMLAHQLVFFDLYLPITHSTAVSPLKSNDFDFMYHV